MARPEVGDRRPGDTVSRERRFALAGCLGVATNVARIVRERKARPVCWAS